MLFNPLPLLLLPIGGYLLIRLRFFYIRHPVKSFRHISGELGKKENLSSLLLALAGTLGVGNLLGVAIGIIIGGAGSLFWLFISAIPSSVIKYAEVTACSSEGGDARGMSSLVKESFPRFGGVLSRAYLVACLLLSFAMGACLQTRTLVNSISIPYGIKGEFIAAAALIIVLISIMRGPRFISKITLFVIPLTTIIYIILAFSIIFTNIEGVPAVISLIISDAFTPLAPIGGAASILLSPAMREGFARGMLSNEAGAGTSTLAHATSGALSPSQRGLMGVLEVYFDTAFLCMLSGLAILLSVPDPSSFEGGMELLIYAVEGALGEAFVIPLIFSVLAFAYSTVICWYYYGISSLRDLVGSRADVGFSLVYLAFVFLGAVIGESLLVPICDALLLVMSLITLPTLIKSSDRVVRLSEHSGLVGRAKGKRAHRD